MTERGELRQPEHVSDVVSEYLEITAPRTRAPRQRPPTRADQERTTRPLIDNRDLALEEGNDFA